MKLESHRDVWWLITVSTGVFLSLCAWAAGALLAQNPTLSHPVSDEWRALEQKDVTELALLGSEVLGTPSSLDVILDVTDWIPLKERSTTFTYTSGDDKGGAVELKVLSEKGIDGKSELRFHLGDRVIRYVSLVDGDLVASTETHLDQKVILTLDPPAPILMSGVKPGEVRTRKSTVKVHDLHNPTRVTHTGFLDISYQDLGGYKLQVPAGAFDARLIRLDYRGKIGPASVESSVYRFYARDVGAVAVVDHEHIHALFVYNQDTNVGRVAADFGLR